MSDQISRRKLVLGAGAGALVITAGGCASDNNGNEPVNINARGQVQQSKFDLFLEFIATQNDPNMPAGYLKQVDWLRKHIAAYNQQNAPGAQPNPPTGIPNDPLEAFKKRAEVKKKAWASLIAPLANGQAGEPIHADEEAELVGALSPPP